MECSCCFKIQLVCPLCCVVVFGCFLIFFIYFFFFKYNNKYQSFCTDQQYIIAGFCLKTIYLPAVGTKILHGDAKGTGGESPD